MSVLTNVPVGALPYERFEEVLSPAQWERFHQVAVAGREMLEGRVVWNVNSTSRGGGVAELLMSLLAYARGAGINARWEVIAGNDPFFALTKRIHNNLHGSPGDGGDLGAVEHVIYDDALTPNIEAFTEMVKARDVVIVHDPQPAGLIQPLKELGATVIWRCHVGLDKATPLTRRAWDFLRPYVELADALVFSRRTFVWDQLPPEKVHLIAPSIDAFSAKNQELAPDTVASILKIAGFNRDGRDVGEATFVREDGSPDRVARRAEVLEEDELGAEDRMVLQVSRWDRLKDPLGVIRGFVEDVVPHADAHLVYAGPAVEAVADDPEGKQVLDEAGAYWEGLPTEARARVHLACLPMADLAENAAIVNALQRRADVVVQKSLAEGFGLTVAEGMWKGRPVVASRIGGIQDQIDDGRTGVLLDDAQDLVAYGTAVAGLIQDRTRAEDIGAAAKERVREGFLGVRSLVQYFELVGSLLNR